MSQLDDLKDELNKIEGEIAALSQRRVDLKVQIDAEQKKYAEEALSKIVGELKSLNLDPSDIAKALGVSVSAVAKKTRAPRGSAPVKSKGEPKYRNSVDASKTWSGKGRKPEWVITYLANGGKLEDLLINKV